MALGYKHPRYLLADLTRDEWLDWVAYHRIQPIGGERLDAYVGLVRQTIAASSGVAATMDDCVPVWFDEHEQDAEQEFLERLVAEEKIRRGN